MKGLMIKKIIAILLSFIGYTGYKLKKLNKTHKNNYIRVLNFHNVTAENKTKFEKKMKWLSKRFQNVDKTTFALFFSGKYTFKDKPGLMITFDDGFSGNYDNAPDALKKHGFTGCYFVSSECVGTSGYMDVTQLKELIAADHIIGCHTKTHYRFSKNDSKQRLNSEIITAKKELQEMLGFKIDMFCWVGGEEETYTKKAATTIKKAKYEYSFMTNSQPVTSKTNPLQVERTNCEDSWSVSLLKFQICGIIDKKFERKRKRVEYLTDV